MSHTAWEALLLLAFISAVLIFLLMGAIRGSKLRQSHAGRTRHHYHAGEYLARHACGEGYRYRWTCCYCGKTIDQDSAPFGDDYSYTPLCERPRRVA